MKSSVLNRWNDLTSTSEGTVAVDTAQFRECLAEYVKMRRAIRRQVVANDLDGKRDERARKLADLLAEVDTP